MNDVEPFPSLVCHMQEEWGINQSLILVLLYWSQIVGTPSTIIFFLTEVLVLVENDVS